MFSKRLQDLTAEDIQVAITSQLQEGGEVEFKETLPAKSGDDPWIKDQQHIGDRARNEILAEVIAFSNAFGGTMVLGVAETDEKPARAKAIVPLPKCVELADRMRLQCRDCIEPQIPMLEVVGVPIRDDGAGVVVFRTPRSRMAPHRHTITRECYVRRADRTEKMTMREIQDLTLQIERGIAAVEAEFARSAARFDQQLKAFTGGRRAFGIRATGVPTVPLAIDRLQRNPSARLPLGKIFGLREGRPFDLFVPVHHVQWTPTLRGIDGKGGTSDFIAELHGRANGLVDYWLMVTLDGGPDPRGRALFPEWLMGLVVNGMCGIERYRRLAGSLDVEYGLEVEVLSADPLPIPPYGGGGYGRWLGTFPVGQTVFPRYSVASPDEFPRVAALIEHDFWNAAGQAWDDAITVDFQRAFKDLQV